MNHFEEIFKNLQCYRQNETLCDVILEAEDTKFPVHRVILSASSEYFKTLFTTDMKEKNQGVIELKGISCLALEVCLQAVYHGEADVSGGNIEEVLHAACLFQMWKLKDVCFEALQRNMTVSNCFQCYKLSQMYDASNFKKTSLRFLCKNFEAIMSSSDFYNSTKDVVEDILRSDDLEVKNECVVYEALTRWIRHDLYYRKHYFCDLFKYIRLQFMPHQSFTDVVVYDPLIKNCDNCCNYVKKWICSHMQSIRASFCNDSFPPSRGGKNFLLVNEYCNKINTFDITTQEMTSHPIDKPNTNRTLHCKLVLVRGSKLFAFGGIDDETVYSCDVICQTPWTKYSAMSVVHNTCIGDTYYLSSVVLYRDHVFVIGGHDGENYLKIVECFDMKTKQWKMLPELKQQRESIATAVLGEDVYVIGGYNGNGLNSVEKFSFERNEWITCAPLHGCRYDSTATTYVGRIYVVGGIVGNNFADHNILRSAEVYNSSDNSWTIINDLHYCRSNMGACVIDERLFVIGGCGEADSSFYEVLDEKEVRGKTDESWKSSDSWRYEDFIICKVFPI